MCVCRHSYFRDNLLVTGFHKQCLCADSCVHLRVRNVCKSTLLRSSLQSQAMLTTSETPLNPPALKRKRRHVHRDDQVDVFTFVQPWADLILDGVRGSIAVCICRVRSHHAVACVSPVCGDARVEMHRLRALVWRTCMFTFSCMRMCGHMYVCVFVCTYVYVYARMYLCAYMYVCVRGYLCRYLCMCVCGYVHVHVCTKMCVYVHMYVCMYGCVCMCMCVCVRANVFTCIHMYIHTRCSHACACRRVRMCAL